MTPDIVFGKGRTIGHCSGSVAAFVLTSANHPGPHLGQWAISQVSKPKERLNQLMAFKHRFLIYIVL